MHVEIGAGTGDLAKTAAGVFILRVAHTRTVTIERGENKGRAITYTNVVRAMRKIGEWHGEAATFEVTELKAEDEGYVVFLQQGTLEQRAPYSPRPRARGFKSTPPIVRQRPPRLNFAGIGDFIPSKARTAGFSESPWFEKFRL